MHERRESTQNEGSARQIMYPLLTARFEYEWRDKEMKVTAVQIFISPYTRVPVLFTATEPHAREQREYTK